MAKQYLSDFETYKKTAKHWTEAFANPNSTAHEEKVGHPSCFLNKSFSCGDGT